MHINWLGQTCVKIQTKNNEKEATVLINAYRPKTGNFPRSFTTNIALYSSGFENAATLSQNPFIVDTLGEFELENIVIHSIPNEENNNIFKIVSEGMMILYLGNLTKELKTEDLEKIMNPDILFLPVGNKNYLSIKEAASLITTLEPRIIIPIGFKCDTEPEVESISKFISEVGLKPENVGNKVIIKQKDLPQEETKLVVLEKE